MIIRLILVFVFILSLSAEAAPKTAKTKVAARKTTEDSIQIKTLDMLENHKKGDWLPNQPLDPHRFREEMELPKRTKAEMDALDQELESTTI